MCIRDRYHTAQWPEQPVDFTGKRVGVVGTGSTGIQVIPVVAEQAEHLTVFQRTPNFSLPQRNGPLDEQDQRDWKAEYTQKRSEARQSRTGMVESLNEQSALAVTAEERERECEQRWANGGFSLLFAYEDILTDEHANELIAEFVRNKIRATVKDPEVAELLCPTNHAFATADDALELSDEEEERLEAIEEERPVSLLRKVFAKGELYMARLLI